MDARRRRPPGAADYGRRTSVRQRRIELLLRIRRGDRKDSVAYVDADADHQRRADFPARRLSIRRGSRARYVIRVHAEPLSGPEWGCQMGGLPPVLRALIIHKT